MKKIKAFVSVALLLSVFTILTACGGKVETASYALDQNGVVSTITFEHKDDKILKISSATAMNYANLNVTKEQAEEALSQTDVSAFEGIDGVTYTIDFSDTEAIQTLTIDFETLDVEKASSLSALANVGDLTANLGFKAESEALIQSGYTKVEK